jgi:hypothetical protein
VVTRTTAEALKVLVAVALPIVTPLALVDGARVGCPLRGGDVDIEECMACDKLLRVVDDDPPYIVCTGWRTGPRLREPVL